MIRDSAESLKRNDLLGMAVRPVKPSDWSTNTGPPYRGPTFTTRNWPNLLADLSPDSATSQTIIWLDTWSEESWRMTSNPHPAIHQPDTKEGQKYIPDLAGITYNQDIAFKINTTRCTDSKCPRHGKLVCINQIRSRTSGRAYNTRGKSNCNTERVVYSIQCCKCMKQYVRQTCRSLRQRFTKHLQIFRQPLVASTLHEHFNRSDCRGLDNITI